MLDLTDQEIDSICAGLRQNQAKVRFLQSLGLMVRRKPDGRPLVNRAHYLATMARPAAAAGDPRQAMDAPRWSVA